MKQELLVRLGPAGAVPHPRGAARTANSIEVPVRLETGCGPSQPVAGARVCRVRQPQLYRSISK
jgi:hypothetical protein